MSVSVCRLTVATYITQRRLGASSESLGNAAVTLCNELTSFPEHVCRPVVFQNVVNSKQNKNSVIHIAEMILCHRIP